ncbi:MAG: SdrD B-like domain-containing protein, partial [Ardenticatenaceae bacterium]
MLGNPNFRKILNTYRRSLSIGGFTILLLLLALVLSFSSPVEASQKSASTTNNIPAPSAAELEVPALASELVEAEGVGVSGAVFRDYNANGARDSREPGVAGITVTAYDASGATVDSTTTAADGTYTLNVASGTEVRVEFSGMPAYLQPGASGGDSETGVTFATSPATDVDMGLNNPAHYCQQDPTLVTPCYIFGDQAGQTADVLVSFDYDAGCQDDSLDGNCDNAGETFTDPAPTHVASGQDIGTTWGVAYQGSSDSLFVGSFMKRHTGFRNHGETGIIYRVDGASAGGTGISAYVDLDALGFDTGTDPHPTSLTSCGSVANAPDDDCWGYDPDSWDAVGKMSFGDIDISDDGNSLWTINLLDRKLYQIPVQSAALTANDINTYDIPFPGDCVDASTNLRPFATGFNDGLVYVGMVCTAETTQDAADMRAYVYTMDPAVGAGSFAEVLNAPLTYPRGNVVVDNGGSPLDIPAEWNPWVTTFTVSDKAWSHEYGHPQPWLTDIEFDNGDLIVGIRDRYGDQMGYKSPSTDLSDTELYSADVAGDILRACPNGSGGWDLESDGSCGGVSTGGSSNGEGPGGGEFYFEDNYPIHDEISVAGLVQVPGSAVVVETVFDPIYDFNEFFDGGIVWFDNETGERTNAYRLFSSNDDDPDTFGKAGGLGDMEALCGPAPLEIGNRVWQDTNGNGIQDPGEPVLVGVTVTLHDMDDNGNQIGSAVVDANGHYIFGGVLGSNMTGQLLTNHNYEVRIDLTDPNLNGLVPTAANQGNDNHDSDATGNGSFAVIPVTTGDAGANNHTYDFGFEAESSYSLGDTVWYDTNQNGIQDAGEPGVENVTVELHNNATCTASTGQTVTTDANGFYEFTDLGSGNYCVQFSNIPAGWEISPPDQGDDDTVDSDANNDGQITDISLGPNDPTNDMGIYASGSIGDQVWCEGSNPADTSYDGGTDDSPLAGIGVMLYADSDCDQAADGDALMSMDTDANGQFSFAGLSLLPAGSNTCYVVEVDTSDADLGNCDQPITPPSLPVELNPDNPTNDGTNFGFEEEPKYTLGDTVWYDTNQDGIQDAGEEGVQNVTAELFSDATCTTSTGMTTVTDVAGFYEFADLMAGDYCVQFSNIPVGWSVSPADQGADDAADSDATVMGDPTMAQIVNINLTADDPTNDMGIYTTGSIGDQVWCEGSDPADNSYDGGTSDSPLAGILVNLYADSECDDAADSATPLMSMDTDGNGQYSFSGLTVTPAGAPTCYVVQVDTTDADLGNCTNTITPDSYGVDLDTDNPDDDSGDFGFVEPPPVPTLTIGDTVWNDQDGDGVQDSGEPGVSGVTVTLYDSAGNPINTTTTDENGNYLFTSDSDGNPLPAGDYQVGFTPPAGYLFTTADQGGDDENDSDADTTTGMTPVFTMADGDTNLSLDAGLFMPAAIGNYVWQDEDDNGKQDAGEQGIPNVKVILLDADGNLVAETTTDADGGYLFPDLPPGSYFVDVDESTLPEGMSQTPVATGNDIGADFNNQDHSGNGYPVTVGSGEENLTADFGYNSDPVDNGSIGDSIWVDTDGDGTQDPDEIGLADVCVELYSDPDGDGVYDNLVTTTMTDANGNYIFNDVTPGAYVVKVCDSNFEPGGPLDGYDPTGDPDQPGIPAIDPDNMTTTPIVVGPGDVIDTIDFGYQPQDNTPLGSIGDTIWLDTDASGTPTQDAGENGIAGVTVALIEDTNGNGVQDADEPIIATVTTDGNGNYLFEDLPLDTSYIVWVNDTDNLLADLKPTYDQDGIDTPNMSATTLTADNPNDLDQDFSYTPDTQEPNEGMIGDGIYFDHDNSGNPTPGDQLIPGVTVILTDENGIQTTTTTDETGHYFFGGLDPQGTYTVTVAPENFEPGGPLEGMDNTGDPDGGLDSTSTVDLSQSPDGINLDQDFGYAAPPNEVGKIGNLIWLDTNADGVYDPATETPIAGVTVDLYQDSNNNGNVDAGEPLFASTTTANIDPAAYGSDGNYIFEGLPAGSYVVDVTDVDGVLAGYAHSQGTPGENNNSQSDPYGVTIEAGGENLTADFGYYVNGASIGNFVWSDLNGDGIQNDGEPGIADVTVTLDITYPDGVTMTIATTTNQDGYYLFDNLLLDEAFDGSGVYAEPGVGGGDEPYFNISVTTPDGYTPTQVDQGGNDLLDSDDHSGTQAIAQEGNNNVPTTPTDPATEDSVASYDFGFVPPVEGGSIGDLIWLDLDGDGVQDPGETGLPGVTVKLVDENGNVITTTTDENGQYLFDGVPPGTYTIMVDPTTLPEDLMPSYDLDGILNDSTSITLQPNEDIDTVDFGYKPTPPELGAIGNYVWLDENTDGLQDAGEAGIPNVVVQLLDGDGNVIESTTTDTDGHYLFPDLPAGDYTVVIPDLNQDPDGALEGLTQSTAQPIPSGSDFGNQTTPYPITLGEGEENLTADFGYHIPTAAIGDFIWVDTDGDGMQDPEEAGVPGVTVNLYDDPDGDGVYDNLVGTTTTDDNGNYLFDDLTPGAYVVEVVPAGSPIEGYTQTGDPDQPGETATNPDNVTTTPVIIGPGDVYLDADFGYQPADNTPVGSIGDTIWFDADGSGTPTVDADEYGIPGVTVALIKDENGNGIKDDGEPVIANDTTDENGNYLFEGLPLDISYIVWVNDTDNVLDGLMPTYDQDGIDTPDMSATTLTADSPDDLDQDFSYTPEVVPPEALIGDTIYLDIDGDGTQDADEPGLQGVIVVLTDQNGNETTVVTDENGHYAFTDVNPDEQYTVTVAPENFQPGGVLEGLDNSGDPDGGNDSTSTVDLSTSGPVNLDQDFGYTPQGPAGSIGNLVWLDTNADGVYDAASETPIGNVTVDLYSDLNGNGQVDAGEPLFGSAVTADTISSDDYGTDGNYLFSGLPAGNYIVDVTDENGVLAGLTHSLGTAGTNNNSQSDPYALSILAGGENLTADFGYYTPAAAVGDTVWVDTDGNGVQDPNEAGVPDVTVNLYDDPDGDGVYDNLV